MEFAMALGGSLLGSGAGVATAAAGAATSGAASAAAGLGASAGTLNFLQIGSGVFSSLASIGAARAQQGEIGAQIADTRFQKRDEYIAGKETSAALYKELANTVANQQVAAAAGGASLSSVSVQKARQQAVHDAEYELEVNSGQTALRGMQLRRQERNLRSQRSNIMSRAIIGVVGQGFETATSITKRG